MRKVFINILTATALLCTGRAVAQAEELQQIGHLLNDALFFSDQYVTPISDAAVYQSVSGWVRSAKNPEPWQVGLEFHANVFFTPQHDRTFTIYNSDFSFFQLQEGTSATVPTAVGNDYQVTMIGMLGDSEVRLKTPEGIDMKTVAYPYLQASLGLPYGSELVIKYSPQVNLKKSDYQVYGFGLRHNLSHYFISLADKKFHISVLAAYSKEEVSFSFLDIQTDYGTLGINKLTGMVDTWQFQGSVSKEYDAWEFMGSFMVTTSDLKYKVSGEKGTVEEILPFQTIVNNRLKEIYKTRVNYIGEVSAKYSFGKFNVQTALNFGKFVNTNVSLQYIVN
ncbi:DUF6588 family protein [Flavobacterium sp. Sd200]|uniref:DUF6588 family protein n=1 Tax=Flavobacterium sp. Sd200 TaxID=2692211 RepID=UPI001F443B68|nr:DUF6588 family protein [Flavobacterium sp. Sd200]